MFGCTILTSFELDLHLREIMGIINNRPLTAVGRDEVITPNNILTGRNNMQNNMLETVDSEILLKEALIARDLTPKLFIETERKRETFWKRFRDQYLESLKF